MVKRLMIWLVPLLVVLAGLLLYPLVPGTSATAARSHSSLPPGLNNDLLSYMKASDALDTMVVASGQALLLQAGPAHEPINTHSVRKSIMSVLYGIAVTRGELQVQSTLAQLGIDDAKMPLTDIERSARIADLLKARSGIYIEAAGETAEMKSGRPRRGQYAPGEHYYYNNWDFNALGSILPRVTGRSLRQNMDELGARLDFEDYQSDHLLFMPASGTEHDQYVVYLSARDLARVGQIMLRDGLDASGAPLISSAWIRESTASHSVMQDREPLDAYGYLWSIDQDSGTVWATGWGGQYLLIDSAHDLVIVVRNDTGRRLGEWLWLVALNHSSQGRMRQVADLHSMLLSSGLFSSGHAGQRAAPRT